jgi:hypothetical protein
MEKSTITPGNILSGSFFGNLLTALSVSSLKEGHNSTELTYLVGASVSLPSRPLAITMHSQMTEGRRNWRCASPHFLQMSTHRPLFIFFLGGLFMVNVAHLSFQAYSSSSIVKDFRSLSTVGISFLVLSHCFQEVMGKLTVGRYHARCTVDALPDLYIGGLLQISMIISLRGGRHGAYRVSRGRSLVLLPPTPLPMKSLRIYREFLIFQINTVGTESVLLVDALTLTLALSTSRSAHLSPSRHSLRIASILVGLATYPCQRSLVFIIPLVFHSEQQSLYGSACGMLWPYVIIDQSECRTLWLYSKSLCCFSLVSLARS